MIYTQLRTPNLGITYTGGMCLGAVQTAFNVNPHKYPNAMSDWLSGRSDGSNHYNMPPTGVFVPIYFSLGDEPAGHVAISLPDGRVASSTQNGTHIGLQIHPNMQNLIDIYTQYHESCIYLGWSEGTGDTRVVSTNQGGDDMDVRQAVKDLAIVATGNPLPQDIEDQKVAYINGGGSWAQLYTDLLQFSNNYISASRVVDDIYLAAGYDPGADVKSAKVGAIAGGFPVDQLIGEVLPKTDCSPIQANLDTALSQLKDCHDNGVNLQGQLDKAQEDLKACQTAQPAPPVGCDDAIKAAVTKAQDDCQTEYETYPWPAVMVWINKKLGRK